MTNGHPAPFEMMRALVGELEGEELERFRVHLDGCEKCAAAHMELEAVQRQGEQEAAPLRLPERRPARRLWLGLSLAAASAAAVLFAILPGENGIRSKGGAQVQFACKDGPRVWHCRDGERVRPGTAVTFRVELESPRWLMLLTRDATRVWHVYLPIEQRAAIKVEAGTRDPMENSLVVDNVPGEERFVLVISRDPFTVDDLLPDGLKADELNLDPRFETAAIRLTK